MSNKIIQMTDGEGNNLYSAEASRTTTVPCNYTYNKTAIQLLRVGNVVHMHINGLVGVTLNNYTLLFTLPLGYRPFRERTYDYVSFADGHFRLYLHSDGTVQVYAYNITTDANAGIDCIFLTNNN